MRPVTRFVQLKLGSPRNNFLAESKEGNKHLFEVHLLRTTIIQCHHVGTKRRLQRGKTIKLIEDNVSNNVLLQLNNNPHALPRAFIANIRDTFNPLITNKLRDLFDHRRLIHLIGNFRDDNSLTVFAELLDFGASTHQNGAAPGMVSRPDPLATKNDPAGWKVGPGNDINQPLNPDIRVIKNGKTGINRLTQIMRRNVGRHPNSNPACTIHQKVGKGGWKNLRFTFRIIVIVTEVDRVFFNVVEQRMRRLAHTHFRVTHGRRWITINRTKIPLPVQQGKSK